MPAPKGSRNAAIGDEDAVRVLITMLPEHRDHTKSQPEGRSAYLRRLIEADIESTKKEKK